MAVFSEHHASDLIFGSPRGNCSVVSGTLRVEVSVRAADSAAVSERGGWRLEFGLPRGVRTGTRCVEVRSSLSARRVV